MLKFIDNYPLSNLTTLQIGGPCKKFVEVFSIEKLIEAIKYAQDQNMSYLVIGGGSNLLVSDEGINSLVIKNSIKELEKEENNTIKVKSGTPLQKLVDYTISQGLSGLQKLAGIPGTVGGAVYGNAGAYGQTISDHIVNVVILGRSGLRPAPESADSGQAMPTCRLARMTLSNQECHFNYRDSIFKKTKDIILEATFKLEPGYPKILHQEAQETIAKRLIKYPAGIKCPGSFFKNIIASALPKEILIKIPKEKIVYGKLPAGALLEIVGAKGQSIDGIKISDNHANLFINQGTGTAQYFYNLAKAYTQKVNEKFNITLEPEVQLINLPPLV